MTIHLPFKSDNLTFLNPFPWKAVNSKSGAGFPTRAISIETSFIANVSVDLLFGSFAAIGPIDGVAQPGTFSGILPPRSLSGAIFFTLNHIIDYPEMAILLAILIQVSNFMMDKILQK